jgi:hypothetical protein
MKKFYPTTENVARMFEEEIAKFDFPCPVKVVTEDEEVGKIVGIAATGTTLAVTIPQFSFKKENKDRLHEVKFFAANIVKHFYDNVEEVHGKLPGILKKGFSAYFNLFGYCESNFRLMVRRTVRHEYRHCCQFRYMIDHDLDMATYVYREEHSFYGHGFLEKDAQEFELSDTGDVAIAFADNIVPKKDHTWIEAMMMGASLK